jgi:hypothetical protein
VTQQSADTEKGDDTIFDLKDNVSETGGSTDDGEDREGGDFTVPYDNSDPLAVSLENHVSWHSPLYRRITLTFL